MDDTNNELSVFRNHSDVEFTHIEITDSEVTDILKILKINKATGPDGVSNRILKCTINTICVPLTKLFNLSLQPHSYAEYWKSLHVMTLFKKGNKS